MVEMAVRRVEVMVGVVAVVEVVVMRTVCGRGCNDDGDGSDRGCDCLYMCCPGSGYI